MIVIESSSHNPSCLDAFLALPALLHAKHPCWTPRPVSTYAALLDTNKNPYWKQADHELFVAMVEGQPVGRIAAVDDHEFASRFQGDLGFFSFFDCIDNQSVANALIAAAAQWLQQRGRKQMRGPYGPSPLLNHDQGIQLSGFDYKQATGEPFHEPFCQSLLESSGMTKSADCLAFRLPGSPARRLLKGSVSTRLKAKKNLCIRPFDITQKERDMRIMYTVMSKVHSGPRTPIFSTEIEAAALDATILNGDWGMVFLALVDDKPAGFFTAVSNADDLYQKLPGELHLPLTPKQPSTGDVSSVPLGKNHACSEGGAKPISSTVVEFAITKAHQKSFVAIGLLHAWLDAVHTRGYHYNTAFCVDERNANMIAVIQDLEGVIVKRMRLYDCDLSHASALRKST